MSPSPKNDHQYDSVSWHDAKSIAGVRFGITKISLGRRIELARRMREIGRNIEFLSAGEEAREKLEAAVVSAEIDRAYLEWGLAGVSGLVIDGEIAGPEAVIAKGPMTLTAEILVGIKSEWSIDGVEAKN